MKGKDEVPLILVGSKCDLESDREVSKEEGKSLAEKFGCPFYETSAKTRVNVDEVFHELVRIVQQSKRQDGEQTPASDKKSGSCCVVM